MAMQQQATNRNQTRTTPIAACDSQTATTKSASGAAQTKRVDQSTQSAMPRYLKRRLSPAKGRVMIMLSASASWALAAAVLSVSNLPTETRYTLVGLFAVMAVFCVVLAAVLDRLCSSNPYSYVGKNDMRMQLLWKEVNTQPKDKREPLKQALELTYGRRPAAKNSITLAYIAQTRSVLDSFFADAVDLIPNDPTNEKPFEDVNRRALVAINEMLKLNREYQANQQVARDTSVAYDQAAASYNMELRSIDQNQQIKRADNIKYRTEPQHRLSEDKEDLPPTYEP